MSSGLMQLGVRNSSSEHQQNHFDGPHVQNQRPIAQAGLIVITGYEG